MTPPRLFSELWAGPSAQLRLLIRSSCGQHTPARCELGPANGYHVTVGFVRVSSAEKNISNTAWRSSRTNGYSWSGWPYRPSDPGPLRGPAPPVRALQEVLSDAQCCCGCEASALVSAQSSCEATWALLLA